MKLLLDPVFTHRQMSKCATWYWLKRVGHLWLEMFPEDGFVYSLIPDEGSVFDADDVVDDPRWMNVGYPYGRDRYSQFVFPNERLADLVAPWGELWDWDLYFTTRSFAVAAVKGFSGDGRLTILGEPFPIANFKKTVAVEPEIELLNMAGYAAVDRVYVNTDHERAGLVGAARRHLSIAHVDAVTEKMTTTFIRPSIDWQRPHSMRRPGPRGPLRVVYTQRMDTTERRFPEVYKLCRDYWLKRGDQVEIKVMTNAARENMKGEPFWDVGVLPREEFYEELERQHVYLSLSMEEGMPFSLLEATAFGTIGVVRRERWSEDFYGADYFGLVSNEAEAFALLDDINAHRVKYWNRFLEWYDGFLERYVNPKGEFESVFRSDVEKLVASQRERFGFEHEVSGILHAHVESGHHNLFDLMREAGEKGLIRYRERPDMRDVPIARRRNLNRIRLHLIHQHGWRDVAAQPGILEKP